MRSNPLTKLRDRGRSEEGFTLIELLVVVVILGILIGISIPVYLNYRKSANDKAAQSDVRNAVSALEVCNSDNNSYPVSVPPAGGVLTATNGCTQTITKTTDTTFRYVPSSATAPVTSYTIYSINAGGSDKVYCYASATGGSVKDATAGTGATQALKLSGATC